MNNKTKQKSKKNFNNLPKIMKKLWGIIKTKIFQF